MNAATEIPSHARKTIADLDAEIRVRNEESLRLTQARSALVELYGEPPANTPTEAPAPAIKKPAPKKPAAATGSADAWTPREGSLSDKVLKAAKNLTAPFTAASVTMALTREGEETNAGVIGTELWKLAKANLVKAVGKDGLSKTYELAK